MNQDNINYKGIEKRDEGDFHVYDIELNDEEDHEFHIPTGILLDFNGRTELRYVTLLEVQTPELMKEQMLTILNGHADNWMETAFSGDVYLKCWNPMLDPEDIAPVGDVLRQILVGVQRIIDSNHMTTADGRRVVLRATLTKLANEDTQAELGVPPNA